MEKIERWDAETSAFEYEVVCIMNPTHGKGKTPTRYLTTSRDGVKSILKKLNNYAAEELSLYPNQYIKPIFDRDSNEPIDYEADIKLICVLLEEDDDCVVKIEARESRIKNGKQFYSARYVVQDRRIRATQLRDLINWNKNIPKGRFDTMPYNKGGKLFTVYNDKKYPPKDDKVNMFINVPPMLPVMDDDGDIFDYCLTYVKEDWKDYDELWKEKYYDGLVVEDKKCKVVYKEEDCVAADAELLEIVKHLSPSRADDYPDWLAVVMALINYGAMRGLKRRSVESLIHEFSCKSKCNYEDDKVDNWIDKNYDRMAKSTAERKLGRNFLINKALKEDDWIYWSANYKSKDYKSVLECFTRECVKVRMGAKWLILRKVDKFNPEPYLLYDRKLLTHYYDSEEEMVYKIIGKDGVPAFIKILDPISNYWNDTSIKTYDNIIYLPCPTEELSNRYFNTWFGWECMKCEPQDNRGDVNVILKHLKEVWCDDNMALYEWWLDWLAYLVCGGRTGVVPIVRGTQGCGKDAFMSDFIISKLLGKKYCVITSDPVNHIFGKFNSGLLDKSYCVIEEGSYDLNTVYSQIKAVATAEMLSIEKKFENVVNTNNRINLIISTNSPCLITGDKGMEQRRLMLVKCSDRYLKNEEYFNRYRDAINNGGAVRMFYDMLVKRFKDKELDPENTMYLQLTKPDTAETNEVKEKIIPLTTQFLCDKLDMDIMENGVDTRINRTTLFGKYKNWCDIRNIKCCDANSFYTNVVEIDKLRLVKIKGVRHLVIDVLAKGRLLELNKDDVGAEEIEAMDEWI